MKQFAEQVVEAGIVGDLHLMTVTALRLQLSEPRLHKTVVWDQEPVIFDGKLSIHKITVSHRKPGALALNF